MDHFKNNRVYSLLGQRGTFGTVLKDIASRNNNVIALSADLTRTSGLEQFAAAYPDRFYNVGIAEENMVGMAAGLADQGYIPFVTTFANFAALRANEFVRHFLAYMQCNVKLVGLASGFAMELFGNTHYGLEDIAVLRSMPEITIISPADGMEVAKCIEFAVDHKGPVYIRLSGKMNNPIIHKEDFIFDPKGSIKLTDGSDVAIFATGSMVNAALKVCDQLAKENISAAVIDVHTIKPFDESVVVRYKDVPLIVSLEEHCSVGGLGSSVAEVLASYTGHGCLLRLGTGDHYEHAGDYNYMLQIHGLTSERITNSIIMKLKEQKQYDKS